MKQPSSVVSGQRVRGLDSLRFVCALWVLLSHVGPAPIPFLGLGRAGVVLQGIYNNLFCGVAAVIVFFIISGFCIHYPFRGDRGFEVASYLVRRTLRIGIPLVTVSLVAWASGFRLSVLEHAILWSLYVELVYYAAYPLLRRLRRRWGWARLIAVAYVAALGVVVSHPPMFDYHSYGVLLNAVLGLPCWMLGCLLAEARLEGVPVSRRVLWLLRGAVWAASSLCSVLRFHSPVGYPWTLNLFALLAAAWLLCEIRRAWQHPPRAVLEWAGQASYSIYLLHLVSLWWYQPFRGALGGEAGDWVGFVAFSLALCAVFYLCVERPSHLIAQRVSRWFKPGAPGWGWGWHVAARTAVAAGVVGAVALVVHAQDRGGTAHYLRSKWRTTVRDHVEPFLPGHRDTVLFLGDSLTEGGDWGELLARHRVRNQGKGGDGTAGVLDRLDRCPRTPPAKVFLMVGINDLLGGRGVGETASGHLRLLRELKRRYPSTTILVQSVLPVNADRLAWGVGVNPQVVALNEVLRRICAEQGAVFVDLHPAFLGPGDKLDARLSDDGLHLNARGYEVWRERILPLL